MKESSAFPNPFALKTFITTCLVSWTFISADTHAQSTWQVDNANGAWNNAANWSPVGVPNAPGATVIFNAPVGGNRNVQMAGAGNITIGNFTFTSSNSNNRSITQSGAQFFLNSGAPGSPASVNLLGSGSGSVIFNNNQILNLISDLVLANSNTGGGILVMEGQLQGAGNLTTSGNVSFTTTNKTYTGATTIGPGRLTLTNVGLQNTPSITVQNGGQLRFSGTNQLGTGTISLSGSGDGTNGALRLQAGTQTLSNAIHLAANATIHTEGGSSSLTLSGPVTGAAVLSKTGGGSLTLNGATDPTMGLNLGGGSVLFGPQPEIGLSFLAGVSGTTLNFGTANLTVTQTANSTFQGGLTGSGSFTKSGPGSLEFTSAAKTYTGQTFITGGLLGVSTAGIMSNTSGITITGGELRLQSNNGIYNFVGLGANPIQLAGGAIGTDSDETVTLVNNLNLSANSNLAARGASGNFHVLGDITGSGILSKSGAGTLHINGTTAPALGLNITNGNVILNGFDRVFSSLAMDNSTSLQFGANQLTINQNTDTEVDGVLVGSGAFVKSGSGELRLDGTANTLTGPVSITGGTLAIRESGSLGTPSAINVGSNGTLRLRISNSAIGDEVYNFGATPITLAGGTLERGGGNLNYTAILTSNVNVTADSAIRATDGRMFQIDGNLNGGPALITKSGSGTVILNGANSPLLGFDVRSGTLNFGSQNRTVSSFAVDDDARAVIGGQLNVNQSINTSVQGLLEGPGGITKSGPGTLAFTRIPKTYTGPTIINGGTLRMSGSGQASQTSSVTINSGGTLELSSDTTYQIGTGPVILNGGRLFSSLTELGDSVVLLNPVQVAADSTVEAGGQSVLFLNGDISGSGTLRQTGSGFVVLRGNRSGFSGQFVGSNAIIPISIEIPRGSLYKVGAGANEITFEFNDLSGRGGLRKTGQGRTVLYGRNTFTGPIRIDEGRLDIGTSESLGNPSRIEFYGDRTALNVTGGSTVVVNAPLIANAGRLPSRTQIRIGASGGSTLILNNGIRGHANVRFASGGSGGNGTVVLNARSRYTGHTTINNGERGIIRLGTNNALPTTTRLRFGDSDNPNPTGRLDLAGYNQTVASLEKNNAADVPNGGIMNSSDSPSTLTVNQNGFTNFDGPFDGKINLVKQGKGTLLWQANSPGMQGTISVQRGSLVLNGIAPNASVQVARNGFFGGYNLIGSLQNDGTVSPGNSPGKMTVLGDFTQTRGGRLVMDLSGTQPGQYDQLQVFGNSSLDGTLALRLNGYIPRAGDEFSNLLLLEGPVTGSFARIETSPLVSYEISTTGNATSARVNSVNFASSRLGSMGANQKQIAGFLQRQYRAGLRSGEFTQAQSQLMQTALAFNSPESVRNIYQQFAADEAGALPVLAFQQSNAIFSWLQGRVDGLRYGSEGTQSRGMDWFRPQNAPLWVGDGLLTYRADKPEYITGLEWSAHASGIFTSLNQDTTSTTDEFLSNTIGGAFGVDLRLPSGATGFFGGYANSSTQFPLTNSQINTDSTFFGSHLTWIFGNLNLTGALAYIYSAPTIERRIPVLDETAFGKTDTHQFSALLSSSYDIKGYGWLVSPTLSLQYSQLFVDGWRENGSAAAQSFDSFSVPSLQLGTGIRIAKALQSASVTLIPEIRAGWQFEMLGNSQNVGAQLAGGSEPFSLVTESVSRNSGVFGAGLTAVFNNSVTAFIDYSASLGSNQQVAQTAYAGLRYYFPAGPSLASSYELPDDDPDWLDSILATPPARALKELGFHGRFQLQYANLRTDAEGKNVPNPGNFNQLFIRRFYFGVERELFNNLYANFTLKYDPEQSGEELSVFEAKLVYQPADWFAVRVGYDKVPFGWEETTSSKVLKTIERSPATRFIGGIGGDQEIAASKNQVAVFGEIPHRFGTAYYDFAIANPSDTFNGLFRNTNGNQLYYYGRMGNRFDTPYGSLDLGADLAYLSTNFRGNPGSNGVAYAAHLQYYLGGFLLTAEFLAAQYEDDPGDPIRNPMGFYITPSYFITPQLELVGQFSWLDGQGSHDIRLNQVIPNAPTNYPGKREYDNLYYWYLGFNYYLRGQSVKFQAGLLWSEASNVRSGRGLLTTAEQTFGARAQLQILW